MMHVSIGKELKQKRPEMALGIITCKIVNTYYDDELWEEIRKTVQEIRNNYALSTIKNQTNIKATREVYKACGKDPNRYRPSAESLYRRIIKNNNLYQINTIVDLVNLISLKTGYSIGGFDSDKIEWPVKAGIGFSGEPYRGIGRGEMNIENLPVIRDQKGAIGTPTSDEERTAISSNTHSFFMNINGYKGPEPLKKAIEESEKYLVRFLQAEKVRMEIVQ